MISLPENPSLDQLRRQARDLQRAARHPDDHAARAFVATLHPAPVPAPLPLSAAQLAVARLYGFPSWPRLVAHLTVVTEHRRRRVEVDVDAPPVARFLAAACLGWTDDDGPHRWADARAVLAAAPDLPGIHVAAARADADAAARLLADDPTLATAAGGPQRWAPLMHFACARHDPGVALGDVLRTARLLLDHGADPNTGYLFEGLCTPFTVLTGVLGGGERDQPPHPHALPLAELLLRAGADPNDGQALYNRMFAPGDDHLRLLLAHGLGRGDGGPWRRRLPDTADAPEVLLRSQLGWAVTHDLLDRIRLLAEHGVDLHAPLEAGLLPGRTPVELATLAGRTESVALLGALGCVPALSPVDALVGAALAGDADEVARIRAAHPSALDAALAAHPGLVVRAAAVRRVAAVRMLVEMGFPVDGFGRGDLPLDDPWETALHVAAGNGDVPMVRELLSLGAATDLVDTRFGTTASGWAMHFAHSSVVALLG